MRWTAWLAEKQGNWWCRGERIGALQPNSTLEFTLGGGSGEATRAWDACVATMAPQDRVEILAGPDWAFGDGAEPHVPAKAHIVFELELLGAGLGGGRRGVRRGSGRRRRRRCTQEGARVGRRKERARRDAREETVEEKALLDDMEEDLLDDVVPDDKEPERQTCWPTGGSIDGETPERWLWRETPERMEVDVKLPRAAPSAKAMKVEFGSQKLLCRWRMTRSSRGPWRAPSSRASAPGPSPKIGRASRRSSRSESMIRRRSGRGRSSLDDV